MLNKLLAKAEPVSEHNFAASSQTKQDSGKPPSACEVRVLCPLLLLQHLNPSFKCFSSPRLPRCPSPTSICGCCSFHSRKSPLVIWWVLKEGYGHHSLLVALHRGTVTHLFPPLSLFGFYTSSSHTAHPSRTVSAHYGHACLSHTLSSPPPSPFPLPITQHLSDLQSPTFPSSPGEHSFPREGFPVRINCSLFVFPQN